MNSDQSFYGYQDWQTFPSPSNTPHSSKFSTAPLDSPAFKQHHPNNLDSTPTRYSNAATSMNPPNSRRIESQQSLKRGRKGNQGHEPQTSPTKGAHAGHGLHASFPTNSFIEQFEATNVQDQDSASFQMRTPPPTRDASSRRKHQHSQTRWATPSTITSRRVSTPGDTWLKRNSAQSIPEASPLNFTPLPYHDAAQFSNTGPLTAPAGQPSDLFWDPMTALSTAFSPPTAMPDDPFMSDMHQSNMFTDAMTASGVFATSQVLQASTSTGELVARSRSARPTMHHQQPPSSFSSFHDHHAGVDPSMLMSMQIPQPTLARSQSFTTSAMAEGRRPYQFFVDELRREKEEPHSRKSSRSSGRIRSSDSVTAGSSDALRRSLTDARAKQTKHRSHRLSNSSSKDMQDITSGLHDTHIPRHPSPLKRQKSSSYESVVTAPLMRVRRSVQLVVDDKGNARTEVKMVPSKGSPSKQTFYDDDSDMEEIPTSKTISRDPPVLTTHNNAHDALRQAVSDRKTRRHNNLPVYDQTSQYHNDSPTTITDPDSRTPISDGSTNLSEGIRCICNANVDDGSYMLQCESCRCWLHIACIGVHPSHIPPTYICILCTDSTPHTRGGRVRALAR